MNELKETKRRRRRVQKKRTFFSLPIELQFLILNSLTPTELNNFLITCKFFCYVIKILEQKNNLTPKEKHRIVISHYSPNNPENNYLKVLLSYCNYKIEPKIIVESFDDMPILHKPLIEFFWTISFLLKNYISKRIFGINIILHDIPHVIVYMNNQTFDNHISRIVLNLKSYYNNLNIVFENAKKLVISTKEKETLFKIRFKL